MYYIFIYIYIYIYIYIIYIYTVISGGIESINLIAFTDPHFIDFSL